MDGFVGVAGLHASCRQVEDVEAWETPLSFWLVDEVHEDAAVLDGAGS